MKRIDTSTAVGGRFVDGNKTTGRKATRFSAEWCNQIQEELCNFLKLLSGADPTGQSEKEIADAFAALKKLVLHGAEGLSVNYTDSSSGENYIVTLNKDGLSFEWNDGAETYGAVIEFDESQGAVGIEYIQLDVVAEKVPGHGVKFVDKTTFNSIAVFKGYAGFEDDVEIGDSNDKKNLTVHGTSKVDKLNVKTIDINEDSSILTDDYGDGDIVFVHNTTVSTTLKVYCAPSQYVELKGRCTMGFIYAGTYFSPLGSVDFNGIPHSGS